MRVVVKLMAVGLILISCGDPVLTDATEPSEPTSTTSGTRPAFETMPPLTTLGGVPGDLPASHWAAILADLSSREVATNGVALIEALEVTWNDGALGCPQPGVAYTQALVDGMKVTVEADGTRYTYHFGANGPPILCVKGRPA
ncbi:MAG: hypothetical protein LC739_04175 [Actinobacteria bacterium]|nr:hypothetical protein [Actinomycetota bacterium]